jgi:hypothetical protein
VTNGRDMQIAVAESFPMQHTCCNWPIHSSSSSSSRCGSCARFIHVTVPCIVPLHLQMAVAVVLLLLAGL